MKTNKNKILLLEDNADLGGLLKLFLEKESFIVFWEKTGDKVKAIMQSESIDLCIYDVMLPGEDGFQIAEKVKKSYPDIPFLFLTAKKQKEDRIYGLKLGADDYISKPFEAEELVLRIKNILKRSNTLEYFKIQIGLYTLDKQNLKLSGPDYSKTLTQKEAELIEYLHQRKNNLVEKSKILEELWGEDDYFLGRSLDVFISRLRKYFSNDPSIEIKNVRGVGFIFKLK